MQSPSARAGASGRQHYRVETLVRLRVRPAAPPGAEPAAPRPAVSDVVQACHGVLDALRDTRLRMDPRERVVADRVRRFCLAVTAAVERIEARLEGEDAGDLLPADVSGGGLGFPSPVPWPVGARLDLAFELVEVPCPGAFHVAAQVASCRPVDVGGRYRVGVEFVDLDEGARERLIEVLFDLQRVKRRSAP